MGNSRPKDRQLLTELLTVLVRSYGLTEVLHCLEQVGKGHCSGGVGAAHSHAEKAPTRKKTTPVDIVERADVPEQRKRLLRRLAVNFEQKRFLPSIGDVRHFLEMSGQDSTGLAQRPEAFRRLLVVFLDMQPDALERLANSHSHGGPSELKPLSDAIRSASSARANSSQLAADSRSNASKGAKKAQESSKPAADAATQSSEGIELPAAASAGRASFQAPDAGEEASKQPESRDGESK